MAKKRVGRPPKLDVDTMNFANIGFIIVIIILIMLLTVGVAAIINPQIIQLIKGNIAQLFK